MELMRGKGPDLGPGARRFDQPDRTLLHLLRAQAEALGDAEWLVFDGRERVTFRGAYEDTNRVARALIRDLGDAPGHVGLFLRNQREFYPALLGPMAAGGVAVPLNADSRGPLLEYVVVKSRIRAIVARADLLDRLAALDSLGAVELVVVVGEGEVPERLHGARVVGYDAWLAGTEPTAPRALPGSHEVALLQFTSGTTGR
jgi:crotonobetaine/carnitine-CoA ligase